VLFYRRKPKPPSSTIFTPLLKLFRTEYLPKSRSDHKRADDQGVAEQRPFLLSGPKSQYGLGIALHFIVIPDDPMIDSECVWEHARREIRSSLIREGLPESEAEVFALRLIDPLHPPAEVAVDYDPADRAALEDFRRLVTYQLLRGQSYDGKLNSLKSIYHELADTFVSLQANQTPSNQEAARMLQGITVKNVPITIRQVEVEKKTILDLRGKLLEMTRYFAMFTQAKYVNRVTPQDLAVVEGLYRQPSKPHSGFAKTGTKN
jgi:hypothetical protein